MDNQNWLSISRPTTPGQVATLPSTAQRALSINRELANIRASNRQQSSSTSELDRILAELNASIAANQALSAQLRAQPVLPSFNFEKATQQARKTVTPRVNALFATKLNNFMEKQNKTRDTFEQGVGLRREVSDEALRQTQEDIGVSRERTEEDVTRNLGMIQREEETFQDVEGRQADEQRRSIEQQAAAAGRGDSGRARQQVAAYIRDRNIGAKTQEQAFEDARFAETNLKERTFDDLLRAEERGERRHGFESREIDLDLEQFMTNWNFQNKQEKIALEMERAAEILRQTQMERQNIITQTGQQLLSSGQYRPQDIELFYNIYR